MDVLAIYGGRFHPAHLGHKSVVKHLSSQFGASQVYVVSSNKQAPISSPFRFQDKQVMWQQLGVPSNHFVEVKNPYNATEITDKVDQNNTAIVYAVSEKDAARFQVTPGQITTKKDGSPAYMQSLEGTATLEPLSKHGYIMIAPTVEFKVLGKVINSASEIRSLYLKANDAKRMKILKDLYGAPDQALKKIFDSRLAITENVLNKLMNQKTLLEGQHGDRVQQLLKECNILESQMRAQEFKHRR